MPTIQDTIIQAVKAKGYRILEDKDALCVILEDLSPGLQSERGSIDKVYNNRVGRILLNAYCRIRREKKSICGRRTNISTGKTVAMRHGESACCPTLSLP